MSLICYLLLSFIIFIIGMFGIIINRKNILLIIMSIELMLLSINLNLIIFSIFLDDLVGQFFILFIIAVAAAESVIGLALVVAHYYISVSVSIENIKLLRG